MFNYFMNIFTKIFFETTNPLTKYTRLLKVDILFSIIFHSIFYLLLFNIITKIFNIKLSIFIFKNIFITLMITMTFGYYFRLSRVKSIYKYLKENNYKNALEKSTHILYKGYFRFFFLA